MESKPAFVPEEDTEEHRDDTPRGFMRTPDLEELIHFPEDFPCPAYFEA